MPEPIETFIVARDGTTSVLVRHYGDGDYVFEDAKGNVVRATASDINLHKLFDALKP